MVFLTFFNVSRQFEELMEAELKDNFYPGKICQKAAGFLDMNLLLNGTHHKLYKESSISYTKMIPSDPTGLLDEIFSTRGLS